MSEIEPGPCQILATRYPNTPNLGDVTKIGLCARYDPVRVMKIAAQYPRSRLAEFYITLAGVMERLGPTDLMVFGSPCQDLSVAGKRKGFTHEGRLTRSGLFHIAMDIFRWLRRRWGARFALWENVPGAFTNNGGRDFAAVVDQMAGLDGTPVPPKGWGAEGCAVGTEAMVEWSTLDAQWFGVAQRRRRVFAIADFGDWASRQPILLEPQGMRGDSAPRREAQAGVAAGALRSTDGGSDLEHARANHLVPVDDAGRVLCNGMWWDGGQVSQTLDAVLHKGQCMPEKNRFPAVLVPAEVSPTIRAGGNKTGGDRPPGTDVDTAESLIPMAVAVRTNAAGDVMVQGDVAAALTTFTDQTSQFLAYTVALRGREGGGSIEVGDDVATCLRASGGGGDKAHVLIGDPVAYQWRVRRLTEIECERLQGMKDNHTLVMYKGKPLAAGPRYKAIGNSMAVTVMLWIGQRVDLALKSEFFGTYVA